MANRLIFQMGTNLKFYSLLTKKVYFKSQIFAPTNFNLKIEVSLYI